MGQRLIYSIAALGFAILVIGGGYYEVSDLIERKPVLRGEVLTEQGWWNGQNTREISAFLKKESKVERHVMPFYNELLFHVAGTSSTNIVAGTDILFLRRRVQPKDSTFWNQQADFTIETCDKINQDMAKWGGRLVVLIVPDRIRSYPERLPSFDLDASPKGPYYDNIQAGLRAKGILSIDFLAAIKEYHRRHGKSELLFRRDDHHWNSRGARLAVDEIVELIRKELPQPDAGLDLRLREIQYPYREGLVLSMGWRKGSALWNRYYEERIVDIVETKKGQRYVASWDEDIAVVADSFGMFDIAEQAAAKLKAPISALNQAGKGSAPPMDRLMEQVKQGWRPRLIIWLMEEKGTYDIVSPLQGWTPTATVAIPPAGKTAIPLTRKQLTPGKGLTLTGDDREFLMTFGLPYGALSVPRSAVKGDEISFYMKPIKSGRQMPFARLHDNGWKHDQVHNPHPGRTAMPNHDGKYHLVGMKVPEGNQSLKLLFWLDHTAPKYFLRSLAFWVTADTAADHVSAEVNRVHPWKAGSVTRLHMVRRDTLAPAKATSAPVELKVGAKVHNIWWTLRTTEWRATQPIPTRGTIRVLLGAGVVPTATIPEELNRLPIVASIYAHSDAENSERMIHQQEFLLSDGPLQWKNVLLPLDLPEGPEWKLAIRFYIPAPLRNLALAGFGSPH